MYLWMVLAAFLATLAAYILPLRHDMDKVLDNPIAEAMLMKMKVKHHTVEKMMEDYSCEGSQKENFHSGEDNCYNEAYYRATDNDDEFKDSSGTGIVINNYIPFGFNLSDSYHSRIKCFCYTPGEDGADGSLEQIGCNDKQNCSAPEQYIKHGLLTYGLVPQHWLMQSPNGWTPSADLLAAFRKNFSSGIAVGTIVKNEDNSYSIQNYSETESRLYPIPNALVGDWKDDADCDDDNNVCFGYLTGIY